MSDIVVDTVEQTVEPPAEQMMQVQAQEAYFMKDCVKVVLTGGVEKLISYESFVGVLRDITRTVSDSRLESFKMPSNVFFFAKSGDQMQISTYYSSRVCNLKYWDSKFDVVTPNIIISHTLSKGAKDGLWKITGSRFFCTDQSVGNLPTDFIFNVNHNARIWLIPLSNTYREGNMCYGNNQMPMQFVDNNLRALDWYYQYLWVSPFNDDLGVKAVRGMNVSDWYKHLKHCADHKLPFPYEKLIGHPDNR